ncbi:hypothetical protein K474DRAFT_440600 [Panus rudis PR-1116 ss-1]|nr:hypothetical protein K474DRAFT_440600 [Panus rudis PR-1116 ss-1]
MDPISSRDANLFSRGPSPPPQQQQHFQAAISQLPDPHVSPQSTHRDIPPQSNSHIDSLFHNLGATQPAQTSPQPSNAGSVHYSGPQDAPASGPATPASIGAGSIASTGSGHVNSNAERQNALLTLLGSVSGPQPNVQNIPQQAQVPPQQIPTPPGSAPRSGPTNNESQGKLLLEQLMSGTQKYNHNPEPQVANYPPMPYSGPSHPASDPHPQPEQSDYHGDGGSFNGSQDLSRDLAPTAAPQQQPQQQQRPPSPARRSMFDFVSPFDALTGSASTQAKRKPVPSASQQAPAASSGDEPTSWNPALAPVDPKRKSVENLMDQITRGQAPLPTSASNPMLVPVNDPYTPTDEPGHPEPAPPRASRPLPPQPAPTGSSPRSSPPKQPTNQRGQRRGAADSPIGQPAEVQYNNGRRDRESSPVPSNLARRRGRSPIIQMQNIVIDVARPLEEIQAPRDGVKSTAIALVRVDSTFLPGTTIGATHWVAYAMTKGRVRVISRSSGDRTLLQLPQLFPPTVAVTDMSVHGNRLAGVTSDGGFVVWELPEIIRDDVPGTIMLCVLPTADMDPLRSVKWHPQDPELVTVASDNNMYMINIADAAHIFGGQPIHQSDLARVAQVFTVPSPIVAFDYDIPRAAIGTISEDSSLTMWSMRSKSPFWSQKIEGEDLPSSLMFLERGVLVGRKNGTIFQLLPIQRTEVHSTIKFVNGEQEDPDMFGHAQYDSRIQTLWIANNRRDSMFAFKIDFSVRDNARGEETLRSVICDQVVEFGGPKPTIHFVILTADADPTGEEANAACVAAKVPPGELALVAFSVHSSGVDQILIRKEWYTAAFNRAANKFPWSGYSANQISGEPMRQVKALPPSVVTHTDPVKVPLPAPVRAKTPPSDDVEGADGREENRGQEGKRKGGKGKNVEFKDAREEKDVKGKGVDTSSSNDSALVKELRKVEDNINARVGRLITKELDKQHQRLEEARANEQAADFVRQEKILKLISTELTKNTTRVVEMAVKAEVQNSVLPSLENITKTEVKAALNNQISKGLADSMKQNLPTEIERMLLRPDISTHIARTVSSAVTPLVERQVKESITKTLIPTYNQQTAAMQQELSRDIHSEILNMKKELLSWQSETVRSQELAIRELEQSVRLLSDQVKYLTLNTPSAGPSNINLHNRSSPAPSTSGSYSQLLRQPQVAPVSNQPAPGAYGPYQPQQQSQPPMHGPWFSSGIAAPQASHPTAPPPVPAQSAIRTPPPQNEEWDDMYLAVLGSQDSMQLRELLARSDPNVVMPLNGTSPLSQAVVLTLVHRLSTLIGESAPGEEPFKSSLWWLQRASAILNTTDPLISPYAGRVLPNVIGILNSIRQRLNIIPGNPLHDTVRAIGDIQDSLQRKPLSL